MATDDIVLLAARNAFLIVLLTLVVVSAYQFVISGGISPEIAVVWIGGAGTFYASKYYYRKTR